MTLLVLRPEPQAGRMVAELAAAGVAALAVPMLEIVAADDAAARVRRADADPEALILTSPQAARILGSDPAAGALLALPAVVVGAGTAAAARAAGFRHVLPAAGDAAAAVAVALATPFHHWVHAAGRDRVGDVDGRLAAAGRRVAVAEIYRAESAAALPAGIADGLRRGAYAGLVVGSARTAESFRARVAAEVGLAALAPLGLAALSAAAAAPLAGDCAQTLIAAMPNGKALMETAIALAARLDQTGG